MSEIAHWRASHRT